MLQPIYETKETVYKQCKNYIRIYRSYTKYRVGSHGDNMGPKGPYGSMWAHMGQYGWPKGKTTLTICVVDHTSDIQTLTMYVAYLLELRCFIEDQKLKNYKAKTLTIKLNVENLKNKRNDLKSWDELGRRSSHMSCVYKYIYRERYMCCIILLILYCSVALGCDAAPIIPRT